MSFSKLFGRIYLAWGGLWFIGSFLLLYPFFVLFIKVKSWQKFTVPVNKIWCLLFFPPSFISIKSDWRFKPNSKELYIYCPNHTSLMDIPVLTKVLPGFICFMGKDSLAKLPLFGYMFRNLHITVNRRSASDRYKSIQLCYDKLEEGRPVVIFPEGTTNQKQMPSLQPFKDGAFRIAIQKQLPVVPVTLPFNGIILPDDKSFTAGFHKAVAVMHEPISTIGMKEADADILRERVHAIILAELQAQYKNEKH